LCRPQDTNALIVGHLRPKPLPSARAPIAPSAALCPRILERRHYVRRSAHQISRVNGRILHVAPEYDDCRKLAVEKNVPLQRVISEALRAFESSS